MAMPVLDEENIFMANNEPYVGSSFHNSNNGDLQHAVKNSSGIQTSNSLLLLQEHLIGAHSGGYDSANESVDPQSFAFLKDIADSMRQQMIQRQNKNRWHAKRFKKFPRFSIYLQRDKTNTYLERNYISLNNKMLDFLAEKDPNQQFSIQETDRDSMESSDAKAETLKDGIHTIDSLAELSLAQHDNPFNKQGASTVKDENSLQEHVVQPADEKNTLQVGSPKQIQTALQTH